MRSAPSVSYPVGRSVVFLRLIGVTAILGLCACALAAWYAPEAGSSVWAGAAAWLVWVAAMVWSWRRQPQGRLAWVASQERQAQAWPHRDAGHWSWVSAAYLEGVTLQRVERVHDLQAWMLLRLYNPDGARSWVWVERGAEPQRWDDLRRALWAHA